jgi:hypothetical protein
MNLCLLQDSLLTSGEDTHNQKIDRLAAPDLTASSYARKKEDRTLCREDLACAVENLIEGLKQDLNFRDLQTIEMIFYCQLRNKDIAQILTIDEKQVALIKHRAIKQIQDAIQKLSHHDLTDSDVLDGLLCELWQERRLSCLKRSTIGSYLLGTLEKKWHDYVHFHLERLGCRFCLANFEDLRNQTSDENAVVLRNRILQSTVGFLSR